ncbi:MAG: hypothetical protein ACOCRO_05095, partial [Halanaerobiales bacterium]
MAKGNNVLLKRNKLLVKILWISLILTLITDIVAGVSIDVIYIVSGIGLTICLLTTYLTYKDIFNVYIKYVVVVGLSIMAFFMVSVAPNMASYGIVYYIIAVSSLYQMKEPIILSAIAGLGYTNYWFFTYRNEMFSGMGSTELVAFNTFIVLVSIMLILQSIFSEELRKEVSQNEKKAIETVNFLDKKIKSSLEFLENFSEGVANNSTTSSEITNEIVSSFKDIAVAVENQA